MGVYGRAGSLIDLDNLPPPSDRPEPGEVRHGAPVPALHRRVVEQRVVEVPSALHPRVPEVAPPPVAVPAPRVRRRPRRRALSTAERVRAGLDCVADELVADLTSALHRAFGVA